MAELKDAASNVAAPGGRRACDGCRATLIGELEGIDQDVAFDWDGGPRGTLSKLRSTTARLDEQVPRREADAGQLLSATTPDGVLSFTYDANGRLEREVTLTDDVAYEHDGAAQLVVRRSARTPSTRYEYDGAGRRVREEQDDLGRRYRLDALGRLTALERDEHTTQVSVDALAEPAEVDGIPTSIAVIATALVARSRAGGAKCSGTQRTPAALASPQQRW